MAARAIWKAVIIFEDVKLPVKLYSAIEDRNIRFRLLHEPSHTPLKQRMINAETGKETEYAEAKRGFEIDRGVYVLFDEEEQEALKPDASREIGITRFVDPEIINHQWYDRPYYLGPDESHVNYFSFVEALRQAEKEGVARWVMRNKEYVGALREQAGYLMLITLRHADEIISVSDLDAPSGRELDDKEIELGEKFISTLETDFHPGDYEDDYRERVVQLIKAKKEGKTLDVQEYESATETTSLEEALEASLEKI